MINAISPVKNITFSNKAISLKRNNYQLDSFSFENTKINKSVLLEKGIISQYQNVNWFYDSIAKKYYSNKADINKFSNYLKAGDVALSSSILSGSNNSAVGVRLTEGMDNIEKLNKYVSNGVGVGINFSEFSNPNDEIRKINFYYKAREKNYLRPPAFMALLDINNKKIDEFMMLKEHEKYSSWCFDLSVIIDDDFMQKLQNGDQRALRIYKKLTELMAKTGEPGIIFSNNPDYITDCCAAVELSENQGFSLGDINLSHMVKNGELDEKHLADATKSLSGAMKNFENPYIGILGYGEMLNKMNVEYGSQQAINILENSLRIIKDQCDKNCVQVTLPPTGTTSRILKTSPSIEPFDNKCTPQEKLDTLSAIYKYLPAKGQVSTTIILDNPTPEKVDSIIIDAYNKNIKGIAVFPEVKD